MKAVVLYFSHGGNTRAAARRIADIVGARQFEAVPAQAYPADYKQLVARVLAQVKAGEHPPLVQMPDLADCDVLFAGSPNWCGAIAPPLATALSGADLSGKTVAPFFTHGGGGTGNMLQSLQAVCPGARILPALSLKGSGTDGEVTAWLQELGLQ